MAGRGGGRGDVRGDGVVGRRTSSSGRGFALDLGFGVLMNGWEAGVGINGIANRIDWTGVQERSALGHLFIGDDLFVRTPPAPVADERVALPVDYRLNAGRHSERWSAVAEYGHGFQRSSFRAGAE